jgi:UDP-glucose 4-epimerase
VPVNAKPLNDKTESRHIVVTGGAGFIGSHLVERLLAEGKTVMVIDDLSTGSLANLHAVRKHPRLKIIVSKVSTCRQLNHWMKHAESVFHLAAAVGVKLVIRSPIQTIRTNLRETEAILESAGRFGVRVLLTSTSEVYGKSRQREFLETDDLIIGPPTIARWSYACSKLMDEFLALAYAKEHQLPVVIARIFNTVGPRQSGHNGMVLPRFIAAAKTGQPLQIYGDGKQTRCFCHVQDTVEALIRLQNCPQANGEIFNVGNDDEISLQRLAKLVVSTLDSPSPLEYVPYAKAYQPGFEDMRRRKPCLKKLQRFTGFKPTLEINHIIRSAARLA